MTGHVRGVDHAVVTVRDLEAARQRWGELGFATTPRGLHSAHMGTGNHCIVFRSDYIELLGVLAPTDHNLGWRELLERREGLSALALATDDEAAARAELMARGFAASQPIAFSRPVELPEGTGEAGFAIVQLALDDDIGVKAFVCRHATPELVWRPEWQAHPNGAEALAGVTLAVADPATIADELARLFGERAVARGRDRLDVATGSVPLHVLGPRALADGYPDIDLPAEGDLPQAVALAIRVPDVQQTNALLRHRDVSAVHLGHRLCVPAEAANGVMVEFVERP